MSKAFVIFKREFEAMVRTKSFVIGTVLMPLIMIGIFAFQFFLFTKTGGGEHTVVIVDATDQQVGQQTVTSLGVGTAGFPGSKPATFKTEVIQVSGDTAALRSGLERRIEADSLDGYLWIPTGVMTGENAEYVGRNASSEGVTDGLRNALQRAVQTMRLGKEGIDPDKVASALQPVRMKATKTGAKGARGSA